MIVNKKIKVKPYLQNPELAYCSLNAVRVVCDYYLNKTPSRKKLKTMLKTGRKTGTDTYSILSTLVKLDIYFDSKKKLTFNNIVKSINKKNLILISYKSAVNESHSSIICGYTKKRGVEYVDLCDSLFGEYKMPFSVLQVLFNEDDDRKGGMAVFLKKE